MEECGDSADSLSWSKLLSQCQFFELVQRVFKKLDGREMV